MKKNYHNGNKSKDQKKLVIDDDPVDKAHWKTDHNWNKILYTYFKT